LLNRESLSAAFLIVYSKYFIIPCLFASLACQFIKQIIQCFIRIKYFYQPRLAESKFVRAGVDEIHQIINGAEIFFFYSDPILDSLFC